MWRAFAKTAIVFTLGVFVSFAISTQPISLGKPSEALTQVQKATPYLNLQAATLLPATGISNTLSEESINARFSGMLSHVRWLIDNQKGNHGSRGGSSSGISRTLFDKQIEKIADNTSDSISNLRTDLEAEINSPIATGTWQGSPITDAYVSNVLTIGVGSTFANNVVTPNSVLSTGQADENCLTYEATGSTFEWQICSNGFASTDIDTSAKLAAILTDETGSGAAVFANSPTLSGVLTAASANFSGNVGIGTTSPTNQLYVNGSSTITSGLNVGAGNYFGFAFNNERAMVNVDNTFTAPLSNYQGFTGLSVSITAKPSSVGLNPSSYGAYIESDTSDSDNTNWTKLVGNWSAVDHYGTGSVSKAHAIEAYGYNDGGPISELAALFTYAQNYGSGTVTNQYGVLIDANGAGGSSPVLNNYGLYIRDQSGLASLGNFNLYSAGVNSTNYFAGNVGIGTTTPASKLSIQNTGTGNSFLVEDQANDTSPFVITANGRVGVGTNAPFADNKMQIVDETSNFAHYALAVYLTGDSTVANSRYGGVDAYVTTKSGNATNFQYLFGVGAGVSHDGTGVLQIGQGTYSYVENSSSGTITNATAYDAYVYNDTAASTITNFRYFASSDLSNAGTITNTYGLYLGDLTSGTQTNAPYAIYSSDAGAKSYFAGNVGIGTTSPAQKLQVFGDIRVGTTGSNGCIENYGGGVIGGTCSSDAALKTDVIALAESKRSFLDGLTALTPVTYHWNETAADLYTKDKNMDNIGFIAQDVEAQFPELVSVNKDGYRQVNFTALPFYIIEALKELWTKVQGHDEKIIKLEEENKNLKERLETVEDKLNIIPPAPSPSVSPPPVEESSTPAAPSTNESITPTPAAVETLPVEPVSDVTQPSEPTSPTTTSEPSFTLVPGASQ